MRGGKSSGSSCAEDAAWSLLLQLSDYMISRQDIVLADEWLCCWFSPLSTSLVTRVYLTPQDRQRTPRACSSHIYAVERKIIDPHQDQKTDQAASTLLLPAEFMTLPSI